MSAKPAILVTGADLAPQALALLADFEVIYTGKAPDEDTITALCEKHQPVAIIVRYGKIPARAMDASKSLRVISKHGAGIDPIDSKAAAARGIAVKAAAGANADAVAEHVWAFILACAKSVVALDGRMRAGYWDKATHKSLELKGKTLGVVGVGAIGRRVAELGVALARDLLGPGRGRHAIRRRMAARVEGWNFAAVNPQPVLARLHYARATKTPYEVACMREASRLAARGHLAARDTFLTGGSEYEAHMAYCAAAGVREEELPYGNIVAYDEGGAVLHYQALDRRRGGPRRSALIDAGAQLRGCATDVTGTWSGGGAEFAGLVDAMDALQRRLCATVLSKAASSRTILAMRCSDVHLYPGRQAG